MKKIKELIFLMLILIIFISAYLSYSNFFNFGSKFCPFDNSQNANSCFDVQNSAYGKILGIKLAYLGLFFSLILLSLFLYANYKKKFSKIFNRVFVLLTFVGAIFAIYFIYVQFFIIETICTLCVMFDILIITIFILAFYDYKFAKKI